MDPAGSVWRAALYSALLPLLNTNVNADPVDDVDDTMWMAMKFIRRETWQAVRDGVCLLCPGFDEHRDEAFAER